MADVAAAVASDFASGKIIWINKTAQKMHKPPGLASHAQNCFRKNCFARAKKNMSRWGD